MTTPSRRRDPQPISRGWELAVVAVGGALIAVALAALVGLGLASALWGGGWVWPRDTETATRVLAGLHSGDPGRGLPADQLRQAAGPIPVYACVAAAELVLLTAAITAGVLVACYRRPGDARGGMATRREAEQALGLRQLRAGRAVIRPDHYPSETERGHLCRLLSTGREAFHRRVHRSVPSATSRSTSAAPSIQTARPPARTVKENPAMTSTGNGQNADPLAARAEAAALFAAASRNDQAGPTAQLHCLAAATALRAPSGPVPATADATDPDRLVEQALRILGNLPAEDFAHPDVLAAAQHGHRALRAPR